MAAVARGNPFRMAAQSTITGLQESTLVAQLRALEQLTRSEAQIATIRLAQARTDTVRAELRDNSDNAIRRATRIAAALRDLDAVPDVVTPALGRVLAFVKATVEQAQPLDEALLGDLALEHQLLARARYVRELAGHLDRPAVVALADDLVTAHGETVDWIETVLAQEAAGEPAALKPTPIQRVSGGVTRLVGLPARFAVERVNRVLDAVSRGGEVVSERVEVAAKDVAATAQQVGADVREITTAGRDAVLAQTEQVADRRGADRTAAATHEVRSELGGLSAAELPIAHFDETNAQDSITAIRGLGSVDDVRVVIAFEQNHKNRGSVLTAAGARLDELADA